MSGTPLIFQYLKELSYRKTEKIANNNTYGFQYLKELSYRKTEAGLCNAMNLFQYLKELSYRKTNIKKYKY